MKIKPILALVSCIVITGMGCSIPEQTDNLEVSSRVPEPSSRAETVANRFVVTSQGFFQAGYGNAVREIVIIKDTKSGKEYLGVTDCSLIEWKAKESSE